MNDKDSLIDMIIAVLAILVVLIELSVMLGMQAKTIDKVERIEVALNVTSEPVETEIVEPQSHGCDATEGIDFVVLSEWSDKYAEEAQWITYLSTAYTSAPEENGGFGAVDCLYGNPLPEDAIAANLDLLPYGTRVYIEGLGERIVVDTASEATVNKMMQMAEDMGCVGWIDVYKGDDQSAMHEWGVRVVKLRVIEYGTGR